MSLDGETLNGHDGRGVGEAAEPPESEALTNATGMRKKSGVELLENDGCRKVFLERLNDFGF